MSIAHRDLAVPPDALRPRNGTGRNHSAEMFARKLAHGQPLALSARTILDVTLGQSVRAVAGRTLIVEKGTRPTQIHAMVDGWACRYAVLPDGRRRIVAFYIPGDICDLDAFLMAGMDQSIATITTARVATISEATLAAFATDHPAVTEGLWWETLMAQAVQRAWTINVGNRAAKQRLAHLLCELYLRSEMVGLAVDGSCALPLTQFHLSDACALTAIHTNRALQDLRREGLLSLEARRLTIHDWAGLVDLAAFSPDYLRPASRNWGAPGLASAPRRQGCQC